MEINIKMVKNLINEHKPTSAAELRSIIINEMGILLK